MSISYEEHSIGTTYVYTAAVDVGKGIIVYNTLFPFHCVLSIVSPDTKFDTVTVGKSITIIRHQDYNRREGEYFTPVNRDYTNHTIIN